MRQSREQAWTTIEAARGWSALGLRDVWEYRELFYFLIWRGIKGGYRQMALGPLWIVLKPLASVLIYTVVFGMLAKFPSDEVPYPIFLLAALLPWHFFSGALGRSSASLVTNMRLISKIYFPRLIIPTVDVISGLVDFIASFCLILILIACFGYTPSLRVLTIPLYLLVTMATALAVGLWLSCFAVKFHDVGILVGYLTQAWMYLSSVLYPSSWVRDRWPKLYTLYRLNPMTGVIEGFRWALLDRKDQPVGYPPDWIFAISCGIVLVLLVTGAYYFRRTERTIVDLL